MDFLAFHRPNPYAHICGEVMCTITLSERCYESIWITRRCIHRRIPIGLRENKTADSAQHNCPLIVRGWGLGTMQRSTSDVQTPPSARRRVWWITTQFLGQGKEFGRLSKSCDYLPQEFRSTNHKAGLRLLWDLLNCPRFWPDQSEYRFILLPSLIKYTTPPTKPRNVPIFFPRRGWGLGTRLRTCCLTLVHMRTWCHKILLCTENPARHCAIRKTRPRSNAPR